MTQNNLRLLEDYLDERLTITKMSHSTIADQSYYNGLMQATSMLGYYVYVDSTNHHTLIKK